MNDANRPYFSKDGKSYQVRFFDCEDISDLACLIQITESPGAQRWMDNVSELNIRNYRKWMDEKGQEKSYLYAVADLTDSVGHESRVQGFVYIYESKIIPGSMEVSYAKRPGSPSGLISPALAIACSLVYEDMRVKWPWMANNLSFLAEIETGNIPSEKVAERAGFVRVDGYEKENNSLWRLNTEPLPVPLGGVDRTVAAPRTHGLTRVRQLNNSYCGPATLQMLVSHFGLITNQEQVVDAAGIRERVIGRGISIEEMALAAKKLFPKMNFWVKRETKLDELEKMVRVYNYPVGVDWQGIFDSNDYDDGLSHSMGELEEDPMVHGDDGHYSVVIDADKTNSYVRIMDPYGHYADEDRFVEMQDFVERWWDDRMDTFPDGGKKYVYENRLMFVLLPQGLEFPREMGMMLL